MSNKICQFHFITRFYIACFFKRRFHIIYFFSRNSDHCRFECMKHEEKCSAFEFDDETKICKIGSVNMAKRSAENEDGEELAFVNAELAEDHVFGELPL